MDAAEPVAMILISQGKYSNNFNQHVGLVGGGGGGEGLICTFFGGGVLLDDVQLHLTTLL